MHKSLKPNGCMVLRTMGRYHQPNEIATKAEFLDCVKNFDNSESNYSTSNTIRFLHSKDLGFDPQSGQISSKRFNASIKELITQGLITADDANPWFFPTRALDGELILYSPTMDDIRGAATPYFSQLPLSDVDQGYCEAESSIKNFYRILGFIRKPESGQQGAVSELLRPHLT